VSTPHFEPISFAKQQLYTSIMLERSESINAKLKIFS
jgi:hypothetical protein